MLTPILCHSILLDFWLEYFKASGPLWIVICAESKSNICVSAHAWTISMMARQLKHWHCCLQLVIPTEATEEILLDVHTPEYLREIKTSKQKVAQVSLTS